MATTYLISDTHKTVSQEMIFSVFPKEDAIVDGLDSHTALSSLGNGEYLFNIFLHLKNSRLAKRYCGKELEPYMRNAFRTISVPLMLISQHKVKDIILEKGDDFVNLLAPGWQNALCSSIRKKIAETMKGFINEAHVMRSFKSFGPISFHIDGHDIKISNLMFSDDKGDSDGYDFRASIVGVSKKHEFFSFGVKSSHCGALEKTETSISQLVILTRDNPTRTFPKEVKVLEGLARMVLLADQGRPTSISVDIEGNFRKIPICLSKAA